MAEPGSGFGTIAGLIMGGDKRMKAQAFEEGRLNTAKTEEALANARTRQLEATAAAQKQRAREQVEDNLIATGEDPKKARLIAGLITGEAGSDYYAAIQGQREQQGIDFRAAAADPETSALVRTRKLGALTDKPYSDLMPVGTHGVVNVTKDEPTLIKGPGSGTTAQKNFEYMEGLPPEKRDAFGRVLRADQIVDAGGGVKVARPTASGGATPVVDASTVASNAAAVTDAKKTGQEVAKMRAEYPQIKFMKERTLQDVTAMSNQAAEIAANEKLYQAFGLTQPISAIPGTEGANLRAMIQTLTSRMMLTTLVNLRNMSPTGGAVGNVSDREGLKMETAMANLSDPNITVGQVLKEVKRLTGYSQELTGYINEAFNLTYDEKGEPRISQRYNPTPADAGGDPGSLQETIMNQPGVTQNDAGDLVREDGWIYMEDASGNAAWVSPNGVDFEPIAQ